MYLFRMCEIVTCSDFLRMYKLHGAAVPPALCSLFYGLLQVLLGDLNDSATGQE